MTYTTQPHPEPSEEASSLPVVAWLDEAMSWFSLSPSEAAWPLVRLSDAQSQLNAMRVERDAANERAQFMLTMTRDAQDIASKANDRWAAIGAELAALKATKEASPKGLEAAPKVDVERIMAMAEVYAGWKASYEYHRPRDRTLRELMDAAREALRASLASPEGSPR